MNRYSTVIFLATTIICSLSTLNCISCIYKPTKKSRYMYSLLVYNENHKQTIQYNKNINGTPSIVEAVSTIQKECKSTGQYKIHFVSCSCANVDRSERKKI